MASEKDIEIKGARVNNLKNINLTIPRGKLVVITGLSGSGKSSLAFDTLYAEGQRRYVESLSSYARLFLGRMPKPECDFIKGLPPAIAIEQKVNTRNSRSTVGTSTEIYDYLRLLFSRIGKTISPISHQQVKKHTPADVLAAINSYPDGTRFALLADIEMPQGRSFAEQLDDDVRLLDSIETAFFEGHGKCRVKIWDGDEVVDREFSTRFEADGITFQEPTDLMFNFNNPIGACPVCEGFGKVIGIDENLVVPNKTLSVYEDAVFCWRGEKMSEWKREFIKIATPLGFPIHKPYYQLTDEQKSLLWHGNKQFPGIDGFFKYIESKIYNIQYRVLLDN